MNQLKFYKYSTLGLLLLNIAMIAFFVLTKPKRPPHHKKGMGTPEKIIDVLNLDEEQRTVFLESAKEHGNKVEEINQQQKSILKPYFNSLIDSNNVSNLDSLLTQYQNLERNKIELTYRHFQEVKTTLKKEQQANFEPFMKKVLEGILPENKKNPPSPKDF